MLVTPAPAPVVPEAVLADLRARIKDEVGATVALARSGRTWRGLCPFHRERTPSFHVYLGRAPGYHCFGCGAHGDIFDWLARTRGLDFPAAVDYLAPGIRGEPGRHQPREPAPVPAPALASDAAGAPEGWTDPACVDVLTLATGHYHAQLLAHPPALDYLLGRGLDLPTITRRRLGYAPVTPTPYQRLAFVLRHHRLDPGLARRVGLLRPDGSEVLAGRIIFPERRASGVIWASGRAFRDPATGGIELAGQPKYLGLPLPPGHRKPLLGWPAVQGQPVIGVVEGQVDQLILADVLGLPTVGLGGAGVGPEVIRRFAPFRRIYLILDRDRAGRRARAAFVAALGAHVTPVLIPRDTGRLRRYFASAHRTALALVQAGPVAPAAARRLETLAGRLATLVAGLDRLPAVVCQQPLGDAAALIEHVPDGAACLLALAEIALSLRCIGARQSLAGPLPGIQPG
jgi:DNA primase